MRFGRCSSARRGVTRLSRLKKLAGSKNSARNDSACSLLLASIFYFRFFSFYSPGLDGKIVDDFVFDETDRVEWWMLKLRRPRRRPVFSVRPPQICELYLK